MAMYGVQRAEKYHRTDVSGIQRETNRTAKHYNNDVDISRSENNIHLIQCDNWLKKIDELITAREVKVRKDSVVMVGSIYTASADFFTDPSKTKEELDKQKREYFKDCLEWHKKTYCEGDSDLIISAVLHEDETTPHMQVYSVPIQNNKGKYSLCAKKVMGGRADYRNRVDCFYNEVSKKYNLERGETALDGQKAKKHIETQRYKVLALQGQIEGANIELEFMTDEISNNKALADRQKQKIKQLQIDYAKKKAEFDEDCKSLSDIIDSKKTELQDLECKRNLAQGEYKTMLINADKLKEDLQQSWDTLQEIKDFLCWDNYWLSTMKNLPSYMSDKPHILQTIEQRHRDFYAEQIEPTVQDIGEFLEQAADIHILQYDDELCL